MLNIYERAKEKGAILESTCVGLDIHEWESLMKGHRKADRRKVVKVAIELGIADKEELKNEYYNPYNHFITKTHIIYVNSSIEHFIRVL